MSKPTPQMIPLSKISGRRCAWRGCEETCGDDLPAEWTHLLTWWSRVTDPHKTILDVASSAFCTRDAVLCGKHTKELEALFDPKSGA